ncbi:hypothetical protein ACC848_38350, partial [Rhizobium johnstonii]
LMPDSADIDDPAALVARLQARARGEEPPRDAFDDALDELLNAAGQGEAPDAGGTESPEDPRPV